MIKKLIFYIGCIVSLILPLIAITKAYASGIALLLGILLASFNLVSTPKKLNKIRKFTLNSAVVLFGFGLNVTNVIAIGSKGIIQTAVSLLFVIVVGLTLAKLFKIESKLGQLITYGTGICGGSAIAATSPVIDATDEDIAISTGVVFILNTVALFLFGFFIQFFKLDANQTGVWTALSIHDTSSVVSAAAIHSTEALKVATVMKLTRTLWIIPIVIVLSFVNNTDKKKINFPMFILFFLLATIFASTIKLPAIYSILIQFGKMLLALSLYFIGTSLNLQTIKKLSGKNLAFGLTLWVFSIISGYLIMMYV